MTGYDANYANQAIRNICVSHLEVRDKKSWTSNSAAEDESGLSLAWVRKSGQAPFALSESRLMKLTHIEPKLLS